MRLEKVKTRFKVSIISSIIGLLIFWFIHLAHVHKPLQYVFYDLFSQMAAPMKPPSKDIAIVAIDDKSLDFYKENFEISWPWNVEIYIPLINYFKNAGAEAVIFDILFLDSRDPEAEENFGKEMKKTNNVYIATSFSELPPLKKKYITIDANEQINGLKIPLNRDKTELFVEPLLEWGVTPGIKPDKSKNSTVLILDKQLSINEVFERSGLLLPEGSENISVSSLDNIQWLDEFHYFKKHKGLKFYRETFPFVNVSKRVFVPVKSILNGARGIGNVTFVPDEDGIFRAAPLMSSIDNNLFPSLSFAVALDRLGMKLEDVTLSKKTRTLILPGRGKIPLDKRGYMHLKYYGGRDTYPYFSFNSIVQSYEQIEEGLKPDIEPSQFKNKIVFVGTVAKSLMDLRSTPLAPICPGVEVNATILDNVLNKHYFFPIPTWLSLIVTFIIAMFIAFITISLSIRAKTPLGLSFISTFSYLLIFALLIFISNEIFKHGYIVDMAMLLSLSTGSFLVGVSFVYYSEGRKKVFLKNAFQYYINPQVVKQLLRNPEKLRLGGERRTLSIFFSDVVGFTTISEKLKPEELVLLLNEYLGAMTDILLESGGTLDKYIGDAIMTFWGAPLKQEDHALRACKAAVKCMEDLQRLREKWKQSGLPDVDCRIGINSGPAIVGNIGSGKRFDYTVMGDTVNQASRYEGANKAYGTKIMIGELTRELAGEQIITREIDIIRVKGKNKPVKVFELIALSNDVDQQTKEVYSFFNNAMEAYRKQDFKNAIGEFKKVDKLLNGDGLSKVYIERCKSYLENPPKNNWDGVYNLKTK